MRGSGISRMVFTLSGSTSIPFWLTMKLSNFPDLTSKVDLAGFNLNWYLRNLLNNFYKLMRCSSMVLDLAIMSST